MDLSEVDFNKNTPNLCNTKSQRAQKRVRHEGTCREGKTYRQALHLMEKTEEPLSMGNILSEMKSPVLVLSFLGERRTSDILDALQSPGVQNVLYLQLSLLYFLTTAIK